ncbi:MAG: hypothetical protein WC222_00320 [Parachlamydiales bacterium]
MEKFFAAYIWKNGLPQGLNLATSESLTYKIVSDPYHKHISIEEYLHGNFHRLIYDTKLLDFRTLRTEIPPIWNKSEENGRYIIRDQNNRTLWIELYTYEQNFCTQCQVLSPHGILLSTHKIFYTSLNHPFNGITLFDPLNIPVMYKKYSLSSDGEFEAMLEQSWQPSQDGLSTGKAI